MSREEAEEAAIAELGRRINRWRMGIVSVAVVAGVVVGIVGYWMFREYQVRKNGVHGPLLTGGVAFGAGIVVMGLGWVFARLFIRKRRGAWVDEIAARHGVAREELADIADAFG